MEPNLVGIISYGFKISWKHKILWIPNILFLIVAYIAVIPFLPFILSPFANIDGGPAPDINWKIYTGFWILLGIVLALLEGVANSCTIVGVLRAEAGKKISLGELADEGYKYIWQVTGIILIFRLIILGMMIASIYLFSSQPRLLSLLCFPFAFFVLIIYLFLNMLTEQVKVSIVFAGTNIIAAIHLAVKVFREFFGLLLMSFLFIGFGKFVGSNIFTLPFWTLFGFSTLAGSDFRAAMIISGVFSVPLSIIIQGALMTFEKSVLTVAYLQIIRNPVENFGFGSY